MDERDSSPQTTLVILLGASEWPDFSDFHGSQAFANVADDFSRYILDSHLFGLPRENFLNLFDTDLSPDKIDKEIRQFLGRRTSEMKQVGKGPTNLLFYFVGHGGFVGKNSEYYLAVRCTSSANPAVSGIRIEPLATTIIDMARYLRRFIILDCCYAAAAFTAFLAEGPAQVAVRQAVDVFKEKAKTVGKGTSLLCSSGKKVTSLFTPDGNSTMFSKALLEVLSITGNPHRPDEAYLSLREVADLTEEVLDSLLKDKAPRPELHSPDQVDGDVAEVPFFPNPTVKALKDSQSREDLIKPEEGVEKLIPRPSGGPTWVVSRRKVVVGVAGLTGLTILGAVGRFLWPAHFQTSSAHTPNATPTSVTTPTSIPLGTLLFTYHGHSSYIFSVVWSPDGKRIASGSNDHTIQVWDAADGGHVYTYHRHSDIVWSVAWSPNGKRIASGSADHTVQVWDASSGHTLLTYTKHTTNVLSVAWSPDSKQIASGSGSITSQSADHTVQVWDASSGHTLLTYTRHTAEVLSVAWSPSDQRIASGSADQMVQVWDAANGGNAYTYRGHSGPVNAVAWSPDGKRIASGSDDHSVQVWDAANGGNAYTYRGHSNNVNAVAWSPDGKRIASGGTDGTVQIWDAAGGGNVYTYRGHSEFVPEFVFAVAWSLDGKRIASGSADQTVQVWVAG